ncbi:maturase K [Gossypium australe]|uniref:Maturase K n=1 Tax=Gossypium australe TaxID=47621 RepID=A0A5B6VVZ9_9ROSI|nr:maturase K [Gossypium australe]
MVLNRAIADEVESNAPTPAQGTTPSESRPVSSSQVGEAKEVVFQMMNEWFTQLNKPPVDKIRKHGAEEFIANIDDGNPKRAEFWLENTIRVFDKLSCTLAECLKCAISLLRDTAYQWWNTLVSVVPREWVTWEFFQTEFKKKYICQRFQDQKHKEFLESKQGRMTCSKYAREYVSTEEIMCKQFVNSLNEDIKLLVKILDFKEFVVLVDQAFKAEDFSREKRKTDSEARDSRKRPMNKPYHSSSKKF